MIFIANSIWLLLAMLLAEKTRRSRSRFWRRLDMLTNVAFPLAVLVLVLVVLVLSRLGMVGRLELESW